MSWSMTSSSCCPARRGRNDGWTMTRWRAGTAFVLLVIGLPLAWPMGSLARGLDSWVRAFDGPRLASLTLNSGLLLAGTLALVLPPGLAGAFLLRRTDVPGRGIARWLLFVPLFVPLPLFVAGWQPVLGTLLRGAGLAQAVVLHALAAL